ncbi:hypothetical protein [Acetonema longum]|uniref:Uncharacterized protein n=1 Tax=Acetonema longum DSM 6540 TaxID=1009370 RepID=F7NK90_9FIRM|nr:hypothetical protein [Acetonema longum]EGO63531.1 hypothetical protein ALO_12516 [Acetonema longum DSM 6540]
MKLKNIVVLKNQNRTVLKRLNKQTGVYCYVIILNDKTRKPFILTDMYGRQMLYKNGVDFRQLSQKQSGKFEIWNK